MAFATVMGNAWQLIDAWATAMLATGSWVDADPALKADGTTDPAGRVLKYTRAGEELYVCMVHAYIGQNASAAYGYNCEVIMAFVSTGWNDVSHVPSGTVDTLLIPLVNSAYWVWPAGTPRATTATAQWWISSSADIWAVLSATASSGMGDCIGFMTFEREAAKEYDDGSSNVYLYAHGYNYKYNTTSYGSNNGTPVAWGPRPYQWSLPTAWAGLVLGVRKYLHPFTARAPEYNMGPSNGNFVDGQDRSTSLVVAPVRAAKSSGNSKVYMAFPIAYADPGTWRSPIKSLKAWFPVEPAMGIADGDLISIPISWNGQPPVTCRYIYKALTSPDGGQIDIAVYYDTPV
jgi:hypothetical protein